MTENVNPFILGGYMGPEYFCDREEESDCLIRMLLNGNNVALIAPRRIGKTSLVRHCFHSPELKGRHTFYIDIYATKSLRDFVCALSGVILNTLHSRGRKALDSFFNFVTSVKPGVTFGIDGSMTFFLQPGDIRQADVTLDQIFKYLEGADRPCIVAVDEFQQIANYPEGNVEALLRTYVQHCSNTQFIFAGSRRRIMAQMFLSPARPFYQSFSTMSLETIDLQKYTDFAVEHFRRGGREMDAQVISSIYNRFEGITWYVQKMLNVLFMMTPRGGTCTPDMVEVALNDIIDSSRFNYVETVFRLPEKQKNLLVAVSAAGKARNITSAEFIRRYALASASSVQAAAKGLLEKDFITLDEGAYSLCDKFFSIWINRTFRAEA